MRSFHFFLIVNSLNIFVSVSSPAATVFQGRGLQKGQCYKAMASLVCKVSCTLDLFPLTQAQISLSVKEITKKQRIEMGHFFEATFQVRNTDANEIKILKLRKAELKEFKSGIDASNGIALPISCQNFFRSGSRINQ